MFRIIIAVLMLILPCTAVFAAQGYNTGNNTQTMSIAPTNENGWAQYMQNLEKRVKINWYPPKLSKPGEYSTTIVFTISKEGHLTDYNITKSSGNPVYDNIALSAIQNSPLFERFPQNTLSPEWIRVEFTFDYGLKPSPNINKQMTGAARLRAKSVSNH